jgi:hypothetical protein
MPPFSPAWVIVILTLWITMTLCLYSFLGVTDTEASQQEGGTAVMLRHRQSHMRGGRNPLSSLFTSSASRRKDNLQELERAKRQEHEEGAPGGRTNHKGHTPGTSSSTGTTFNQRKDYETRYPPLDTARTRSFVAGLRETSMDVGIEEREISLKPHKKDENLPNEEKKEKGPRLQEVVATGMLL